MSEPPSPVPLRRNQNFRLLWIGQVLSELGSTIGYLAYPLLVLALTRSAVIAGAVGTITSAVAFVVRLPAGALADRLDRRLVMVICDLVRTLVLTGLAAGVALHAVSWPIVLLAAVVDRVGDTIFTPSSNAALPLIVADEQLEGAWAAVEARQYSASLAGPAIGGFLFGLGRAVPFVADAVSYLVSVVTSARMKGDFQPSPREEERKGLWREALDGIRLLWRDPLLRSVFAQAPLINFAFTGVIFTVIIALRRHGTSPAVIGLTQAGLMAGGLLGAIAAPKLQGKLSLWHMVVMVTGLGTVFFAVAAVLIPSPLVALPIAITLFLSPTANAALFGACSGRRPRR